MKEAEDFFNKCREILKTYHGASVDSDTLYELRQALHAAEWPYPEYSISVSFKYDRLSGILHGDVSIHRNETFDLPIEEIECEQ